MIVSVCPIACRISGIPLLPGFATVFGNGFQNSQRVDSIFIFWMNTDLAKYPAVRPREWMKKIMHLTHLFPIFSFVTAAINNTTDHNLLHLSFIRISFAWFWVALFFMVI